MSKIDFKYKANYYLLLLIAFTIPLSKVLIPPLIGLFFISSLLNNNFKVEKKNYKILLLSFLYILYLIGILYSENQKEALFNAEEKLSLLLFPLAFFFSKIDYQKKQFSVIKTFIEGCLISTFLSMINSIIVYYYTHETSAFFYQNISIYHHGSYLSMYLTFAIASIYYYSFNPSKSSYIRPVIGFSCIMLFSIYIALLSSKTGIISMLVVHIFSLLFWIIQRKIYVKGAFSILAIIITSSTLYLNSTFLQTRVNEVANTFSNDNVSNSSSTGARKQIWKASFSLLLESPIVGYGPGDVQDKLNEQYKQRGLKFIFQKKLNAHNQYLQTTIALGLIGFLVLFSMLWLPLYLSIKKTHWIYIIFISIIAFNFLTESMLETQSGVVFYAFFNTLFFVVLMQQKQENQVKIT